MFIDAPLEECKSAIQSTSMPECGEWAGIDSVYERPESPEIHQRMTKAKPEACVGTILQYLR